MAKTEFRWALEKLREVGLIVCLRESKYFVKPVTEGYIDLSKDPEIKALLSLEKANAEQIIRLAQKMTVAFSLSH
jgi:hypothetical protein